MRTKLPTALALLALAACSKKNDDAVPPTYDIVVKGRVYNGATGAGIPNLPLSLDWRGVVFTQVGMPPVTGYTPPDPLASGVRDTTDAAGNYELHFRSGARGQSQPNYLGLVTGFDTLQYVFKPGAQRSPYMEWEIVPSIDKPETLQLDMPLYNRATLTVRQHRTSTGAWTSFSAAAGFGLWGRDRLPAEYLMFFPFSQNLGDSTVTLATAAGVPTVVYWGVGNSGSTNNVFKDSIVCSAQGPNVYTINW